jgi:GNAT superfamily N-acetyltransferase
MVVHVFECGAAGRGTVRRTGRLGPVRAERLDPDQWGRLRDVRLRAVLAEPALYGWAWERESSFTERHWRMRLSGGAWWIASDAGADVGVVSLIAEPGAVATDRLLVALWVEPGARRRGGARALVAAAAAEAVAQGARTLTAWVPAEGDACRAFWSARGFVPTGEAVAAPRAPGGEEARWSIELTGDPEESSPGEPGPGTPPPPE